MWNKYKTLGVDFVLMNVKFFGGVDLMRASIIAMGLKPWVFETHRYEIMLIQQTRVILNFELQFVTFD